MKTHPASSRRIGGFTLVELLVVISIIVVLAAMSLTAVSIAGKNRRKLESQAHASSLYQALDGFYRTYGRMPDFGASGEVSQTEGQSGQTLLTILLGKEEPSASMQNKQGIRFLDARETMVKAKGGLLYSNGGKGATPEGLYDASGKAFYLKIDTDYDGEIEDPLTPGNVVRNKNVIIYSYGTDGKPGTSDDVKTW